MVQKLGPKATTGRAYMHIIMIEWQNLISLSPHFCSQSECYFNIITICIIEVMYSFQWVGEKALQGLDIEFLSHTSYE